MSIVQVAIISKEKKLEKNILLVLCTIFSNSSWLGGMSGLGSHGLCLTIIEPSIPQNNNLFDFAFALIKVPNLK